MAGKEAKYVPKSTTARKIELHFSQFAIQSKST